MGREGQAPLQGTLWWEGNLGDSLRGGVVKPGVGAEATASAHWVSFPQGSAGPK
jgi:hypothetical protein